MAFNKEGWTVPAHYGCLGWYYLLVSFVAFLFFFLAAFKCWLTISGLSDDMKIFVGYWSRELPAYAETALTTGNRDRNYCVSWDSATKDSLFDGAWKFGKAIGVMGSFVCIPVFVASIYIIFYKIRTRFFSYLVCANIVMSVFSILLLSGLGSDVCKVESCRLGPGGYLAIVDFFLWIVSAILAFRLKLLSQLSEYQHDADAKDAAAANDASSRPSKNYPEITDGVEHEVSQTENDDGTITRKTVITTKSPGGRKKRVDAINRKMPAEEP